MFKVLDVFQIGKILSVTLEGDSGLLKNGVRLKDENGNVIVVNTVAMAHFIDPGDMFKKTIVSVDVCDLKEGDVLTVA